MIKTSEVAGMVNGWMLVCSSRRAWSFFWKLTNVTEYHMYYISSSHLQWNPKSCHDAG